MVRLSKHMDPRRRFMSILVIAYVLSLPVISAVTYMILRNHAVDNAYERGQLYLITIEAVKHYVEKDLRPALYRELPGRFVLEGMSRSYVSAEIARKVNSSYQGYLYRTAQLENPRNPDNLADPFEAEIIRKFQRDPGLDQWQGNRNTRDGKFFVITRRGKPYLSPCMMCHGSPGDAPQELVGRYGSEAGFGIQEGSNISATFVYIPITSHLTAAKQKVLSFIALYTVFLSIVFLYINHRWDDLYNQIEKHGKNTARINKDLADLNMAMESMVAERTLGLMALTVADKVRNPAAIIGGACRHVLAHDREDLPEGLRNSLDLVVEESAELESIVRDFEALVHSRKSRFKFEDVNALIEKLMPVLMSEAEKKNLTIEFKHSAGAIKLNLERNLFRNAMYHLAMNAIEATPEGGEVVLNTVLTENNVEIVVTDTGSGLPEGGQDRLFEPFYSTKDHSYGLGLPLVKQIVTEHMGQIMARSLPEGGAEFLIRIPLRWKSSL